MRALALLLLFVSFHTFGQSQNRLGLLFDDEAYEKTPLKARNVAFQSVVSEHTNFSLKQFVPEIRDQGGYGTCVGWASAYYGRTILEARKRNSTNIRGITDNAYSPVFTYLTANVDDDYNCQGGAFIPKALDGMVNKGVPLFKNFSVMCETSVPDSIIQQALANRIKDYSRLFGALETNDIKIESVKRALINGNPAVIGFRVENSFYSAKPVFEPDSLGIVGGHAMCVIGYDDEKYGGSFEIVNSWGKNWGNDGFIWVRYEDFANYTAYAFEMIPLKSEVKEKNILAGELELQLRDNSTIKVVKGQGNYKGSVYGFQKVVVEEESQSIGDYITDATYPKGTRYRMITKVNKPAYVYVIGADLENESTLLFPENEAISSFINSEKAEVIIPFRNTPNQKVFFELDTDVKSDYSIVIFSLEKIDLPKVKSQLDDMKGELLDKLYVIFKEKLINKDDVILKEGKMGFNATFEKGTMAMMILDIRRS